MYKNILVLQKIIVLLLYLFYLLLERVLLKNTEMKYIG